jgi:hypothetical protein
VPGIGLPSPSDGARNVLDTSRQVQITVTVRLAGDARHRPAKLGRRVMKRTG